MLAPCGIGSRSRPARDGDSSLSPVTTSRLALREGRTPPSRSLSFGSAQHGAAEDVVGERGQLGGRVPAVEPAAYLAL